MLFLALALVVVFVASCGGDDKNAQKENEDLFNEDRKQDSIASMQSKDSALLLAIKEDKTTISAMDIAPGDTSYSVRSKVLYKSEKGEKLAAVYGMKSDGSLGIVIVQKEGGKPITLKQIEIKGVLNGVYSDGKTTFRQNEKQASLTENGGTSLYTKIE